MPNALPTHVLESHRSSNSGGGPADTVWKHALRQGTLAGNGLVVGVGFGEATPSTVTVTVTDDQGNTWPAPTVSRSDDPNGARLLIYVFTTPATGTRKLTFTFSRAVTNFECQILHAKNMSLGVDGGSGVGFNSSVNAASTTWTPGAITTATAGDWIVMFGLQDTGGTNFGAFTPNAALALSSSDQIDGWVAQEGIQGAAGAITASATGDSLKTVCGVVAIKMDSSGTSFDTTKPWVRRSEWHYLVTAGVNSYTMQFPCMDNGMLRASWVGGSFTAAVTDMTSITDSHSNVWSLTTANDVSSAAAAQHADSIRGITSSDTTVTINTNSTAGRNNVLLQDVYLPAGQWVRKQVVNASGNDVTGGNVAFGSLTPSAIGTLIETCVGVNQGTTLEETSGTINREHPFGAGENGTTSGLHEDNGWAGIVPTSLTTVTPTYTVSIAVATWGAQLVEYAPSASGAAWRVGTRAAPGQRGPFDQRGFLNSPFRQYSFTPSVTLNAYTLTAAQGTFTLTGNAANLLEGHLVTAAKGTFTVTGNTANLLEGHVLPAAKGTFVLTGNAANLLEGHVVTAATGTFVLNGIAANLTKGRTLAAAQGAFAVAGVAANLLEGHLVGASTGAFVLAGKAAALDHGYLLSSLGGTFALSGVAAALSKGRTLTADVGTFALAGMAATLVAPAQAPVVGGGGNPRKPFHGGLVYLQRLLKPLETKVLKKIKQKRKETLAVHNETERLEAGVMPLAQLDQLEERAETAEFEEELRMLLMILDGFTGELESSA